MTSVAGEAGEGGLPHSVPTARTHQPRRLITESRWASLLPNILHTCPSAHFTGPTKSQRAGLFA